MSENPAHLRVVDSSDEFMKRARHAGGGEPPSGDVRLALLEAWARTSEERMVRTDEKLDRLIAASTAFPTRADLAHLPTRSDLRGYVLTGIGLTIALMAILVGALGWLDTRARAVQGPQAAPAPPIIINVPATAPAAGTPSK